MKTLFACTYVSKDVEIDHFENGCSGNSQCILAEGCNIAADSLSGLLKDIGQRYGLEIDDVWVGALIDSGDTIGFNRLENGHGNPPSELEKAKWREGKCQLWLADYMFRIEIRQVAPITLAHFQAEGIKTHD